MHAHVETMASRTFASRMTTAGKLDAGVYKCDITVSGAINEEALLSDMLGRIDEYANANNGKCESRNKNYPTPARLEYSCTFQFLNLESMLYFAQTVPYPQRTRAIDIIIDYDSLIALI